MIPKQPGTHIQPSTHIRFLLFAAVIRTLAGPSAGVGAQEPSDGWDEVARPAAEIVTPRAAVAPTTFISRTWIGSVHERFRIDVRFSQDVTGFAIEDIQVIGAVKEPPLRGSGGAYYLFLTTQANYDGPVIINIPSNVARNSLGDGNIGRVLAFDVDNKSPTVIDAKVNADLLGILFDESLDEAAVPSPGAFSVSFLRGGSYDVKAVSRVEVFANELLLLLASPVDTLDAVRVFYEERVSDGARDPTGNRVAGFDIAVRNVTGEVRTGFPGAPSDLTAVANGPHTIELNWDPPATDGGRAITGYRIDVSADGGGTWSNLVLNTRTIGTYFRDDGLPAGVTRHYRVSAVNFVGAGPPSNVASATTRDIPPGRPRQLTARARGTSAIELNWNPPIATGSASVTGYRIEVSRTGTGGWLALVADTDSRETSHTHTNLAPGSRRHYRVAAINRAGRGGWSDIAQATTDVTTPGAPTGLQVFPGGVEGTDRLLLTWAAPVDDGGSPIIGYRIDTSATGVGGWSVLVTNTSRTITSHTHAGLAPGTTRYYRVAAVNARGSGRFSNVARGATNAAPPASPRNARARATGPNAILLAWDPPASDGGTPVTGYSIRTREPGDLSWIVIRANTGTPATTFTHTDLQPLTRYEYQVAAVNRVGVGPWSATTASITHPDIPGTPTGLTADAVGTSRIDLAWFAPRYTGGAGVRGYRIEASDDRGVTWNIIRRNTNSTTTTFSDLNLSPATTRHYRVAAINIAGVGEFSDEARATTDATLPGAPRTLVAEAEGTSRINLSWRAPSSDGGAELSGYRIEVSEDGGVSWEILLANTRSAQTTHSDRGLEPATTRHYRVSAVNRIGVGEASSVASATTDATVPDAPTGLVATAITATRIDLAWVPPAYDGGAPITGYRVEVSETGAAWVDLVPNSESTTTTFSHTGLRPGTTRHYRVSAINRAGMGAASASASAATDDPVQRAGRLNARVLPHVASAMTSSTVSAIARRVDVVANGMGTERRVEANGLSSLAASLSAPGVGGLGLAQGEGAGVAALFGGTSFQTPLGVAGAPAQSATGTRMAGWGAGEYHHLGEPGAGGLDWKGNMVSAHVGVDARVGPDLLAGVAASYSSGSFDFTDKTGARPVAGTYGATMTSVHPYLAWFSGARGSSVWGSAGYGTGDIEVDDARAGSRTSPASMLTGAAGASYPLFLSDAGAVRVRAEGWAGLVTVDGAEQIDSVTLNMRRGKLALELTQHVHTGTGHQLALLLEGGMRYDDGDGVNGAGAEVGGGLRYVSSSLGLTAEGRGRFVLSAREGYEEWGIGGMLVFDPATRGQGLSIRVAPSWGDAASGVNQLWERGVSDAVRGGLAGMGANVDGEVAYGIAGFHGTPYGGFHLAGGGERVFSSGVRYDLGSAVGVRLEGARRESGFEGPRHSVGFRGRIRLP